jgi:diadenosine tetraphosphate (Ap4A) HIT family hydrolase
MSTNQPDPRVLAVLEEPTFPFDRNLHVKPLEAPVVPEPDRWGEDPAGCGACDRADDTYLWTDDSWRLSAANGQPLTGVVILESRAHYDSFADLPDDLTSSFGPVLARVERAVLASGDVGRVHLHRWGDGGAHFHVWFIPRPLGRMQMRGSNLPVWLDVLDDPGEAAHADAWARTAAVLAATGGTSHVEPMGSAPH